MLKIVGKIVGALALVGVGFLISKFIPAGGPPAGATGGMGAMPPPVVRVVETQLETASPVLEYIAHVEPIQEVMLTAQIEGIIDEVHFQEGSRVKKGDLLFSIDPAPYQARLAQREAELAQAQAMLDRAEKYWTMLSAADGRSVSRTDRDTAEANVAEGRAQVQNAQATLLQAQIDLGYTQIASPIDGRIGRALITRGNFVSPSSGPLASVVQIDPIRVAIAMPDSEYITQFERYSHEQDYNPLLKVRLANGTVFSAEGEIDFDDNQMDRSTGTMAIRLRFPNPDRMLVPNAYVTAMVQDRNAAQKIVLPMDSVMHGADGPFVWVVKEDQTVEQVAIATGAQMGDRQIVESGLQPGRRVIYAGMQKVRPGATVSPVEAAHAE
jgi:membrane fusion protein (multidrug efflux system)